MLFPQKVQKELLQSDVQSKSDKSPVTVADYGLLSSSSVHAFHLLVISCLLFWILIMNHMRILIAEGDYTIFLITNGKLLFSP